MSEGEVTVEALNKQFQTIDPDDFEKLVADLWEYLGYNTNVTKGSNDGGVDVVATREIPYKEKVVIQAKRWKSTVGGPDLREYISHTYRDDVDAAIVIGTAGFTKSAKEETERHDIKLINGRNLADMFIEEDVVGLVEKYANDKSDDKSKEGVSSQADKNHSGGNSDINIWTESEFISRVTVLGTKHFVIEENINPSAIVNSLLVHLEAIDYTNAKNNCDLSEIVHLSFGGNRHWGANSIHCLEGMYQVEANTKEIIERENRIISGDSSITKMSEHQESEEHITAFYSQSYSDTTLELKKEYKNVRRIMAIMFGKNPVKLNSIKLKSKKPIKKLIKQSSA